MLGHDLFARLCLDHDVTGKDVEDFDLASADSCRQVIEETAPEVVVNAAAYTNVDGAEADRERCFAVNAGGVKNLVEACRGHRIKIVHFSTDYVFDGTGGKLYREEDAPNPINVYGASKLAGERFLEESALDCLLIRTAWLYGRNGKNFVRTILEKAETQKALTVVDDQTGSPTFTWDLAGAVKILVEGGKNGIFHVTNRGYCSWYDFARKIIQYAGYKDVTVEPCKTEELARPAKRPPFSGLSGEKFVQATGKTLRTWQLALHEFIDHRGYAYHKG
jgi:dTDP-4-dehydrorhamnose reductase